MRKYYIYFFYFILIHFYSSVTAQQFRTITNGENILAEKPVVFKNTICKITPEINYNSDKPDEFEIKLKAEWFDTKNRKIEGNDNFIYLIDNFEKFKEYHRENGLTVDRTPKMESEIKKFRPVSISKYSEKTYVNVFENGYNGFNNSSKPIKVKLFKVANSLIQIDFMFFHVVNKGNRRSIKEAANVVSWKFMVPDLNFEKFDCEDLKSDYDNKLYDLFSLHNIVKAKELKSEIEKEPDFNKCPEIKNSLLSKLEKYIEQEAEIVAKKLEEKKDKEKTKTRKVPAREKTIDWSEYENTYEDVIADFNGKYNKLKIKSDNTISNINTSINKNTQEIHLMENIFQSSENLSLDSVASLKIRYEYIKGINQENKNRAEKILDDFRSFNSKLKNKRYRCKSDFIKVDKTEGLKKFKKFSKNFDLLIRKVNGLETLAEDARNKIDENNNLILNLLENFDKETMLIIKRIKTKYDSLFGIFVNKILQFEDEYKTLRGEFEDNRYNKWYFKSKKKKFIGRANKIYDQIIVLQTNDSITKTEKNNQLALYEFNIDFDKELDFDKILLNLKPDVRFLSAEIEEWPANSFPYLYLILFLFVVSTLLFGARVYLKALKAKNQKSKMPKSVITSLDNGEKPSGGGITITQTQNSLVKGKGLFSVRQKSGIDFLELDMSREWNDSAVAKIYFQRDCIIKTYRFFEDSIHDVDTETTANETGGYLIGRWDFNNDDPDKYDVSLEDFIEPGDDASFSRYQLNFGAKIGVKLQKSLENCRQKENLDFVMTAWFHSHPGLKIFLSDFDLTVQEDFSRKENKHRMVALVIDPYTDNFDTGIFTYKAGGEMNNAKDSKQFFSLENMYQWAISPVNTNNHDNYFTTSVNQLYPDSIVNKVFFSNPCILEIKRHIEDNSAAPGINEITTFIGGYKFFSDHASYDIVCENLVSSTIEETSEKAENRKITGCLIATSGINPDISQIINKPEIIDNQILMIILYNYDDNTLMIISRNREKVFNKVPEVGGRIAFTDMVTWTRKRK